MDNKKFLENVKEHKVNYTLEELKNICLNNQKKIEKVKDIDEFLELFEELVISYTAIKDFNKDASYNEFELDLTLLKYDFKRVETKFLKKIMNDKTTYDEAHNESMKYCAKYLELLGKIDYEKSLQFFRKKFEEEAFSNFKSMIEASKNVYINPKNAPNNFKFNEDAEEYPKNLLESEIYTIILNLCNADDNEDDFTNVFDIDTIITYFTNLTYKHEKNYINAKLLNILLRNDIKKYDNFIANNLKKLATGQRLSYLRWALNLTKRQYGTSDYVARYIEDYKDLDMLSKLTRGELQNFIISSSIPNDIKILLIKNSANELIDLEYEELEEFKKNSRYGKIINEFEQFLKLENDKKAKQSKKKFNIKRKFTDQEIKDMYKINDLEIKNLIKILSSKNLNQKFKWIDDINYENENRIMFDNNLDIKSIRGGYYHLIAEEIKREFYETLGIDYDTCQINHDLGEDVSYGIEIEEAGVDSSFIVAYKGFKPSDDTSIKNFVKGDGKVFSLKNNYTAEYISKVFNSNSLEDLEIVMKQIDILNFCGASTNNTCGFHIHVSTENSKNYDYNGMYLNEQYEHNSSEHYVMTEDEAKFRAELDKKIKTRGFLMPYYVAREIYNMQGILADKLNVFSGRVNDGYAKFLDDDLPNIDEKNYFVNLNSLFVKEGVEFRAFNMPDHIDKKVAEAYIDFATSYYLYMEEGNETEEYFQEAVFQVYDEETDKRYKQLFSKEELIQLRFDILLEELCLKEDTKKILRNMDKIFEFYNVKEKEYDLENEKYITNEGLINYYDKYDINIEDEKEENYLEI